MESKAATSRLPKMSANLMNCSMTALGNSGVGGDWPASTEGTTSVRTIRARRCMRSPKMLAQRKLSRRPFERKTSAAHHASPHGDLNQAPRIHLGHSADSVRGMPLDRKSTRLNSSHSQISYAVFCLKKKNKNKNSR